MNSYYQLLALLFNYVYGGTLAVFISRFYNFFSKEPILLFFMLLTILILDFLFIYLVIIYKLFFGIINYNYLLFFMLGVYSSILIKKRVNLA